MKISKGTISMRKDGLFIGQAIITYDDNSKKRISVSSKTEAECRQKLELKKALVYKPVEKEVEKNITSKTSYINYLLTTWLAEKSSEGCNQNTVEGYRYYIKKHFIFFNDLKAEEIKQEELYEFQTYCKEKMNLSAGTYKKLYHILNNSFNKLIRDNVLDKNPLTYIKKYKGLEKEKELFTEEEINNLLKRAKDYRLNYLVSNKKPYLVLYPFLLFALHTGCRRSEICALMWSDIDIVKMTCNINKSIQIISNKGGKPIELISPPKNKKSREVPINKKLLDELLKLKDKYNSEYVFPDYRNPKRFISPRSITNAYTTLRNKLGITKGIHVFRHNFISNALEKGISLRLVQKIVGHSSLNITQRYWKPDINKYDEIRNLYNM